MEATAAQQPRKKRAYCERMRETMYRWRASHKEHYNAYMREYMKARAAKEREARQGATGTQAAPTGEA